MIRALQAGDLPAVEAIARRAFGVERAAPSLSSPHALALFDPDRAAYAHGVVIAGEAELHEIAVDPALRRAGAGRALLDAFAAAAAARGASVVHLEVAADNEAALALYRSAGFDEVGRRPRYYPSGADAVLMSAPTPAPATR